MQYLFEPSLRMKFLAQNRHENNQQCPIVYYNSNQNCAECLTYSSYLKVAKYSNQTLT